MKPTELQIGDWVQSKAHNGKTLYTRIVALDNRDKEKHIISSNRWIEDYKFEPIPLTPEIFVKNGWRFIEGTDYSTFPTQSKWINQVVPFKLRVDCDRYVIDNRFNIIFVHQLQQALRLCGLEELADSIVI